MVDAVLFVIAVAAYNFVAATNFGATIFYIETLYPEKALLDLLNSCIAMGGNDFVRYTPVVFFTYLTARILEGPQAPRGFRHWENS